MFRRSSSDDSEISDSFLNSKSAMRVSVCLKRYFEDVRSRCYIHVVRNRRVRWLEKRLQKIFSLPGGFCISANGHLLPSSEPLALLRPEDSLEVIPLVQEHMEMMHKKDTLMLDANNQLERHVQNGGNVSESHHTHVGINRLTSISSHKQTILEETYDNSTLNEVVSTSNFKSIDDIDATEILYNPQNLVNSVKETAITLQQLKCRTLALIDAQLSARDAVEASEVAEDAPPRRVRRRIRRRARRHPQQPELVQEPTQEIQPKAEQQPEPRRQPEPERKMVREPQTNLELLSSSKSDSLSESEPFELEPVAAEEARAASPVGTVARNGAAISRRARVVRPLSGDN